MQSRSWSHLVRVTKLDGARIVLYCTSERGVLKSVGDVDTAPGQRVAMREGSRWRCTLSWAKPECRVERRRIEELKPSTIITYGRTIDGQHVLPILLAVTAEDAGTTPLAWSTLRDKGVTFPASEAPYKRMASLTPEERKAYWASKAKEAARGAA